MPADPFKVESVLTYDNKLIVYLSISLVYGTLIRWAGLDPKGKSWECSWEPSENLDCDERISEWLMVSSEEAARRAASAEAMGIVDHLEAAEEAVVAAVEWVGDVRPLKMDLSTDWDQEGSIVQHICDLVGLSIDQIKLL